MICGADGRKPGIKIPFPSQALQRPQSTESLAQEKLEEGTPQRHEEREAGDADDPVETGRAKIVQNAVTHEASR